MQNVLCLFPFKPVKDEVLPSSGNLFLFNLDVPDTFLEEYTLAEAVCKCRKWCAARRQDCGKPEKVFI